MIHAIPWHGGSPRTPGHNKIILINSGVWACARNQGATDRNIAPDIGGEHRSPEPRGAHFLIKKRNFEKWLFIQTIVDWGKRHQKTDTSWHSIGKNSILTLQIEGSLKFLQMKKINVSPCARTSPWHHWDLELYVNWIQHVISECSSLPQSEHKSRLRSVMHLEELLTGPFEWPRVNQTSFI